MDEMELRTIERLLREAGIRYDGGELRGYATDASFLTLGVPNLVAFPKDEAECVALVDLAIDRELALVPRGTGSGTAGGGGGPARRDPGGHGAGRGVRRAGPPARAVLPPDRGWDGGARGPLEGGAGRCAVRPRRRREDQRRDEPRPREASVDRRGDAEQRVQHVWREPRDELSRG